MDKKESSENPYLNAKREWNIHEGASTSSRKQWQIVAIISLLIALCSISGMIYTANQSKFIPYVVQVDKLGTAVMGRRVDRMDKVSNTVIKAVLVAWIADARLVTPDIAVQREAIFRLYSHMEVSDASTLKMNDFLNGNANLTPFARAVKEVVHVEITSALPMSKDTWQVDWIEHVDARDGNPISRTRWRAMLNIEISPPASDASEEQLRRNPLGVFVKDFQWTRQI